MFKRLLHRQSFVFSFITSALLVSSDYAVAWPTDPSVNVPVTTAGGDQEQMVVAPDGAGGAFIAWIALRTDNLVDVFAQHLDGSGDRTWLPVDGVLICGGVDMIYDVSIVPDGAGGAIIAWVDELLGAQDFDIYFQWIDTGGAPHYAVDGIPVCTAAFDQYYVDMAVVGDGGVVLAWIDERWSAAGITRIYAQRFDGESMVWAADGVSINATTVNPAPPEVVSSGDEFAIVVWVAQLGSASDAKATVFAQKLEPVSGTVLWNPEGVAVTDSLVNQYSPGAVADNAGGVITFVDGEIPHTTPGLSVKKHVPGPVTTATRKMIVVH